MYLLSYLSKSKKTYFSMLILAFLFIRQTAWRRELRTYEGRKTNEKVEKLKEGENIALLNMTFTKKYYSALVETSLVKNTLCGEWENKIEKRASGNNVMRNRVTRGLGVVLIKMKFAKF